MECFVDRRCVHGVYGTDCFVCYKKIPSELPIQNYTVQVIESPKLGDCYYDEKMGYLMVYTDSGWVKMIQHVDYSSVDGAYDHFDFED